jgi:PAS domain S-box-containing protein
VTQAEARRDAGLLSPSNHFDDLFRAFADNLPTLAWIARADGYIVWYNRRWHSYTGTTADDMEGWGWQSVHHPDVLPSVIERWSASIASGAPFEMTLPLRGADGVFRPFLTRVEPVRDARGEIANWFGTNTDVSGYVRVQDELREKEAIVGAFFETAGTYMAVVDLDVDDFSFVTANQRMARFWGCEDITGRSARDLLGRSVEDSVMKTLRKGYAAGKATTIEYPYASAEGERWFVATLNPMPAGRSGLPRLSISSLDITDRKRAEAALAESEAKFRTIANAMPQMVWSTLPDGYHDYFNDRWYEFTGVPYGSTDGEGWNDMFHPEDQERAWTAWRRSLSSGEPYEVEYRLRHHSGEYRWVLGRALPIRSDDDAIVRWMGTCTDIHDNKLAEGALAEALEVKDVLLHEVNHRVKNSLQLVTSLLMLQASQTKEPELKRSLMEARARIGVVAAVHQRLYSTSQHDRVEFAEYLRELAAETIGALGTDERIRLVFAADSEVVLPLTKAVPLALVVSELLTNSVKYAFPNEATGTIRVELYSEDDAVRVLIADDGCGLPDGFNSARSMGIGMRIVTALTRQIRASVSIVPQEPGAGFEIRFSKR